MDRRVIGNNRIPASLNVPWGQLDSEACINTVRLARYLSYLGALEFSQSRKKIDPTSTSTTRQAAPYIFLAFTCHMDSPHLMKQADFRYYNQTS